MHNKYETLGDIIKIAREQSNFTVEQLAEKVGISERYLYKIENEGKKPSYDVLYKLIRTLSISADIIFYPEKMIEDTDIEYIINILSTCNHNSVNLVKLIIQALIATTQNFYKE